jgi:glycosyltransferase involved in cell wall biosynthesis
MVNIVPSLLVIGLPRSLTSLVYQWSAQALGLRRPCWTTDGEVLNADRFTFALAGGRNFAEHYLTDADGEPYRACLEFARTVIEPSGCAYKIVTQPVVAHALLTQPGAPPLRILRIVRNLADVALALLQRGWLYPARLDGDDGSPEALLRGLVRTRRLLRELPGGEVQYDDVVWNPKVLPTALQRIYPEMAIDEHLPPFHLDEGFLRTRDSVLARRETSEYRHLEEVLRRIEEATPTGPTVPEPSSTRRSARPRLLAVGDAVAPTGFGRVMEAILGAASTDFEVTQIGLKFAGGSHHLPWTVVPSSDQSGAERLVELAKRTRPDVIFMLNDIWVVAEYVRALRSLDLGARLVVYCPVDGDPVRPEHVAGLRGVHRLITFTEYGRQELERAAQAVEDHVTWGAVGTEPHGVDTDVFRPLASLTGGDLVTARRTARRQLFASDRTLDDAFIILNANRNQPRKRIDLTMLGFAKFARGRDDVRLYLHMGTQDQGWKIRELADRLEISGKLLISIDSRFQPAMPSETLNLIYNGCDVGLNTSVSEGWGLVPFEHAATGAAQVLGDHTASGALWRGHAELLDTHLTVISPALSCREYFTSPDLISDRLTALYEDRGLLERRSAEAYAFATREEFRWSTITQRWRSHLRDELAATYDGMENRDGSTDLGNLHGSARGHAPVGADRA